MDLFVDWPDFPFRCDVYVDISSTTTTGFRTWPSSCTDSGINGITMIRFMVCMLASLSHGIVRRVWWTNVFQDAVPVIRALQLPFVSKTGYAPLRCTWLPGCPAELSPLAPKEKGPEDRDRAENFYASAFKKLLPDMPVPESIGAPCSSQFAVTREHVRLRPKSDYERMRKWLLDTELSDGVSGRILEYTWHSKSASISSQSWWPQSNSTNAPSDYAKTTGVLSPCWRMLLRHVRSVRSELHRCPLRE